MYRKLEPEFVDEVTLSLINPAPYPHHRRNAMEGQHPEAVSKKR
jgi:hypothetical protein